MTKLDVSTTLKQTQLFGVLDEPTLQRVADRTGHRRFKKDEIIFHQGDPGNALYVVHTGLIGVFVTSEDGGEILLATLAPGDSLGELALVDGGPRSASARAIEASELLTLSHTEFVALLEESSTVAQAVLLSMGGLMRRLLEQTSDLVFLDLPGRVAKFLHALAHEKGEPHEGATMIDLQISQGNLAAMVGGSRSSVNQILRSFEARGYIELDGRRIVIHRLEALGKRAGL